MVFKEPRGRGDDPGGGGDEGTDRVADGVLQWISLVNRMKSLQFRAKCFRRESMESQILRGIGRRAAYVAYGAALDFPISAGVKRKNFSRSRLRSHYLLIDVCVTITFGSRAATPSPGWGWRGVKRERPLSKLSANAVINSRFHFLLTPRFRFAGDMLLFLFRQSFPLLAPARPKLRFGCRKGLKRGCTNANAVNERGFTGLHDEICCT